MFIINYVGNNVKINVSIYPDYCKLLMAHTYNIKRDSVIIKLIKRFALICLYFFVQSMECRKL